MVQLAGGQKVYGKLGDLKFYGQESQGVGGLKHNVSVKGNEPTALGLAGFKVNGSARPAEGGSWTYHGYAIGVTTPAGGAPGPAHAYSSANAMTDIPGENEGRVTISLNKEAVNFDNFNVHLDVRQTPSTISSSDIVLGTPDCSYYVEGNEGSMVYNQPGQDLELQIQDKGNHWTWGEWDGQADVDTGSGPENRDTQGEMVAGRTLSPTEFQSLVSGAASYNLHTPSTRPGMAGGIYTFNSEVIKMAGTSHLQVNIPGSGMTPTWSGNFQLQNSAGDHLTMAVPMTPISPNGHLQGTPTTYQLDINGRSYNHTDLTQGDMTGSLVGPGSGPVPVSGAIGEGSFRHGDGSAMDMVYGSDLTP